MPKKLRSAQREILPSKIRATMYVSHLSLLNSFRLLAHYNNLLSDILHQTLDLIT